MRVRLCLAAALLVPFSVSARAEPFGTGSAGAPAMTDVSRGGEQIETADPEAESADAEQVQTANLQVYLRDETPAAVGPGTPITGTPEPSAVLLFGTGAMAVGAVVWRRRRLAA